MDNQPKYLPQAGSAFFADGATMRVPVEGTVARGDLELFDPISTGRDDAGDFLAANPVPVDAALLERGKQRMAIYCAPCHGERADGKGILFERARIETPSFYSDRVRGLSDGQVFDAITNGMGLMGSYRYPIPPRDRWAIIAYVRELERQP
jgi:mono/diheme cytochrome c family protein